MIENYFNCLIELDSIKNELGEVINLYIRDKNINISVIEVILLHLIIDDNGTCYPGDLNIVTKKIASNNSYNLNNLVKKGFLINEDAKLFGLDGRRRRLTVTKSGRKFYEGLSDYIVDKFKKGNKTFESLEINMFDPILREVVYLRNNIS